MKTIDDFFKEVDADGGGTLDVAELTDAMRQIKQEASQADTRSDELRERMSFIGSRLEQAEEALRATSEVEDQEESLEMQRANKSTEARLGNELRAKNTKIADLVAAWESTNGEVRSATVEIVQVVDETHAAVRSRLNTFHVIFHECRSTGFSFARTSALSASKTPMRI